MKMKTPKTMTCLFVLMAVILAVLIGCATEQQMLQQNQPSAVDTALARGRFDLNCSDAKAIILSSDFIQPAIQGAWAGGINRTEYTIGIEGCGKRTSYVVICQEGTDTCFAAHPSDK
jgi:hypothetical protein